MEGASIAGGSWPDKALPMIGRALAEAVMRDVIAACDPAVRVRAALGDPEVAARLSGRRRFAFAVGKAALAMARGAGEIAAGIAVVPAGAGGELPPGWRILEAAHPVPDERSVAAGLALQAFVRGPQPTDVILALISGGASALAEVPVGALDELVATIRGVMAAGAAIDEINTVRGALSAIKAGQLAREASAPIVTLAVSDVIGDSLAVIGSGPTVGPWLGAPGVALEAGAAARRLRARAILERHGVVVPPVLAAEPPSPSNLSSVTPSVARSVTPSAARLDHAAVIAPMTSAAHAAVQALASRGVAATLLEAPIAGDVEAVARMLAAHGEAMSIVAWGEPTLRLPADHGTGGRAQQLALVLARWLRGTSRSALVVGTDGIDGPPPAGRPAPAGAWVDGTTWDAIAAAGRDPAAALATCDAGTALAAAGALIVTGPSGINHADLVIIG